MPESEYDVTYPRDGVIRAAGGLVVRRVDGAPQVLVVHRPKYDDWSLPKGKLNTDEHPLLAAVREVAEETGYATTVGRPLQEIRYLKDGQPVEDQLLVGDDVLEHRRVESDVGAGFNLEVEVGVVTSFGAARVNHHHLGPALLARSHDALVDDRVTPSGVRADQHEKIGVIEVLISARDGIRAKRADVAGNRLLVTFFREEPPAEARSKALALADRARGPEELHFSGRELFIFFPEGMGRSKLPVPQDQAL